MYETMLRSQVYDDICMASQVARAGGPRTWEGGEQGMHAPCAMLANMTYQLANLAVTITITITSAKGVSRSTAPIRVKRRRPSGRPRRLPTTT